ncbi:MAG: AAA family ATPase [Allosphingosinicella sp.]
MIPLYGHDDAVAAVLSGLQAGRLHHAWLITGPMGIGKATFAKAAALRMLAGASEVAARGLEVEANTPTFKLFAAEAHPDFHLVEREVWDKQGNIVPKHERSGSEDLGRNIRIKQIRLLNTVLSQTTSISDRRVIVIDSVDDLEPGAANALLKSLEEPPASTVFLLVSHSPARLLPTIRSRCRALRLAALGSDAMASALANALPEADADEIASLVEVGEGAPGRAIAFRGLDIDALDRAMRTLIVEGDPTNARRAALAQSLATKSAQPRYEAFLARAPSLIAAAARERRGPALAEALALWERASELAGAARRHSLDPQSIVFELGGLLAALAATAGRDAA